MRPVLQGRPKLGVSSEVYVQRLIAQDYRCAICGKLHLSDGRELCVDHDHITGVIRGLLCRKCNLGIGCLGDNPQTLIAAATYLDKNSTARYRLEASIKKFQKKTNRSEAQKRRWENVHKNPDYYK